MSYYERHIFFCLNQRDNGENSCMQHHAEAGFDRCKSRVKAERLAGPGGVRVTARRRGPLTPRIANVQSAAMSAVARPVAGDRSGSSGTGSMSMADRMGSLPEADGTNDTRPVIEDPAIACTVRPATSRSPTDTDTAPNSPSVERLRCPR